MSDIKNKLLDHLSFLVDEIGPRPAGTPAHHRVEAYIRDTFNRVGLVTSDISVDFPHWAPVDARLAHDGETYEVAINPFSPSCDTVAPIIGISTLPELESTNLKGRIVLLYGELSKAPIFPINFEAIQFERDMTINRLLIEKSPEAIIAINLHPWRKVHIFEDEDFPLPSVTVSPDVGRELLSLIDQEVHLYIKTQVQPSHVTTIVGHKVAEKQQKRIVICAHYDTKFDTPGASDNGTGIALMLTLAELLLKEDQSIGLEFIAWADEEYGAHTDTQYVKQMGDGLHDILCVINMDGVGLVTENTTVTALSHSGAFEQAIRRSMEGYPALVWTDPWIQSNHATFAMRGVPAVALSSLTWERSHQDDDTLLWISPDRLEEVVRFVRDLIRSIYSHPPAWSRA